MLRRLRPTGCVVILAPMKALLIALAGLLLAVCASQLPAHETLLALSSPPPKPGRPLARPPAVPASFVLIVLDDVGPSEMARLPTLDALADQGTSFEWAYAWPLCSLTRAAMMLGRYPRREGIGDNELAAMPAGNAELPLERNAIGEVFAPTYQTGYFGKWHLGRPPIDTGESMGLSATDQARIQAPLGPLIVGGFEFGGAIIPDVPNAGQPMAEGFYKWWQGNAWRLAITIGPYANDVVRDSFLAWWPAEPEPRYAWLCFPLAHAGKLGAYEIPPGGTDQATTRGDFEEGVAYLDQAIQDVLDAVDLETTFVVVTSDNGTPDDARPEGLPSGFWKGTCFEGGVHVPLIVAGPGVGQGVSTDRLVSLVDLPATMAELAGLALTPGFEDSRSFANALGTTWTGTMPRDFVFMERYGAADERCIVEKPSMIGQVQVRLKVRWFDPDAGGPLAEEAIVYDLIDDPTEQEHAALSTLPPQIRNRLLAELASIPARQ